MTPIKGARTLFDRMFTFGCHLADDGNWVVSGHQLRTFDATTYLKEDVRFAYLRLGPVLLSFATERLPWDKKP